MGKCVMVNLIDYSERLNTMNENEKRMMIENLRYMVDVYGYAGTVTYLFAQFHFGKITKDEYNELMELIKAFPA